MCESYTTDRLLGLFARVLGGEGRYRHALIHAAACDDCRRVLERGAGWSPPRPPFDVGAMLEDAAAFRREARRRLCDDLLLSERRLQRLERRGLEATWRGVLRRPELWTPGLSMLLVERSQRDGGPGAGLPYADLAVSVADLAAGTRVPGTLTDQRAYTWALFASVLTGDGRLGASEHAWRAARRLWALGSRSERLQDLILRGEALLRSEQHRYAHAVALLAAARRLPVARSALQETLLAWQEGKALFWAGEPAAALQRFAEVAQAPGVDLDLSLRLRVTYYLFAAHTDLVLAERDAGRRLLVADELLALRRGLLRMYRGKRKTLLLLDWLRGRLLVARGDPEEAEASFTRVMETLLAEDRRRAAAVVALDRAAAHAERGTLAELRRLAAGWVEVFRAAELLPEVREALARLCTAGSREAVARLLEEAAEAIPGAGVRQPLRLLPRGLPRRREAA